jgi:4-carboxymuconolactone decarboxylase
MEKEMFARGLETRKKVLGADHVERSWSQVNDFNRQIQEFITRYAWGEVWNRPGLPHKTRSMLNIAMLGAMGHEHELKLHVQGALRNGVSQVEIQEILLQLAIYAGVPASLKAFRIASEAIESYRPPERSE